MIKKLLIIFFVLLFGAWVAFGGAPITIDYQYEADVARTFSVGNGSPSIDGDEITFADEASYVYDGSYWTKGEVYRINWTIDSFSGSGNIGIYEGSNYDDIYGNDARKAANGTYEFLYMPRASADILVLSYAGHTATVTVNFIREVGKFTSTYLREADLFDQEATTTREAAYDTVAGTKYRIVTQSTLDFTTVGADDNNVGTVFLATSVDTLGSGDELAEITAPHKGTYAWPYSAGAEAIDVVNDQDFNTDIGNWTLLADGAGTLAHDTENLSWTGESGDDKQAKLVSNPGSGGAADTSLVAQLPSTEIDGLDANKLHRLSAKIAVPAGNTLKAVAILPDANFVGAISSNTTQTIAGDTWIEVVNYVYFAADIIGNIDIGFVGDPTDDDILYFDDISIKPVQTSWTPYGTNLLEIDESSGAIKITGVDNSLGASLTLRDSKDLSGDLVVGDYYSLSFNFKVGTGDTAGYVVWNGIENITVNGLTNTDFESKEVIFSAGSTNDCVLRGDSVANTEEIYFKDITIRKVGPMTASPNISTLAIVTTSQTVDFDITVTGSPDILWRWGDGTTDNVADPGVKDFGTAATRRHELRVSNNWADVTRLDLYGTASATFDLSQMQYFEMAGDVRLYSTSVTGDIADLPSGLTGHVRLQDTSVTGDIANLPIGLTDYVYLHNTSVTGDIANLPSGLTGSVNLYNTSVTGDIANLPTGLTGAIRLYDTSVSDYTSGGWPCNTGNDQTIDLDDLGLTETEVDDILCELFAHGATGGTLDLTGNTAPSGTGDACVTSLEGIGWTVSTD